MPRFTQLATIAACALALCISGCDFAPKYQKANVEVPPAYKETEGWKVAQPSDAALRGKWWEIFSDTQLNSLEEQVSRLKPERRRQRREFSGCSRAGQASSRSIFPHDRSRPLDNLRATAICKSRQQRRFRRQVLAHFFPDCMLFTRCRLTLHGSLIFGAR